MKKGEIAYINPELLKYARIEIGLSIEEASKNIVTKNKLNAAELGKDHLTFNKLIKISNRYKLPITFFYLNKPYTDSLITQFRSIKSREVRLTPELRKSFYDINLKRNLAIEFKKYDLNEYNYEYVNSIELQTPIKQVAEEIRHLLHFKEPVVDWKDDYQALNNWIKAMEDLGILVFQISKIPVNIVRGFSISKTPYPTIVINRADRPFGRIYSIVHEFVHIISIDNKENIFYSENNEFNNKSKGNIEAFCNKVAAEVLMPETEFIHQAYKILKQSENTWNKKNIKKISKHFWVSQEAILIRLKTFSLINKKEFDFQMKRLNKNVHGSGFENKQHMKVIRTNSYHFLNNLLNAYAEREITASKLSKILQMKLIHLDALEKEFWKNK
ncbi:MAG: XRE family transcriptional regulator [Candidatus Lokiarchaeota archaeon]|nr:XRE family transcriptional regulator [Candidatus Harpocratesius repetitus]